MIEVLMISGSLRKGSFNTTILKHIQNIHGFKLYEKLGELPLFNADLNLHTLTSDDSPKEVQEFRKALNYSEAIIISTPEYAHQIPGVLKNALDWVVSSGELQNKPVMVISATPTHIGGDKVHKALTYLLNVIDAKVIDEASLQVAMVNQKINDKDFSELLKKKVTQFLRTIEANKIPTKSATKS